MSDLFAADLRRLLWRPMTRFIGGFGVVIVGAVGVIIFVHTSHHYVFTTRADMRGAVADAVLPLSFAAFALGASALGADYASRALTTLLTWEPRRRFVLASRACASALVTAAVTLVILLALVLVLLPSAIVNGTSTGLTGAWYLSMAAMTVRCVLFIAAMSTVGVAAAALGRSTTAAVIGMVGYLILFEYTAVQASPSLACWLLVTDAISWVGQNADTNVGAPEGHTVVVGGLLIAAATVTLWVVATRTFERRDVT